MMHKLPNGKVVYQQDIECVHDPINGKGGIYIGNLEAAENIRTLNKYGIKAVLTACKGTFLNHSKTQIPYQLYIPGVDHQSFDLSKYFTQSVKFIQETLQSTNILVHCLGGVSRSVALVMAYFIKCCGMTYDEVYRKLKARRRIIHPNDSFIQQLKKYERNLRANGQINSTRAYDREEKYSIKSLYTPERRLQTRQVLRGYEGNHYNREESISPPKMIYQSPQKRISQIPNRFSQSPCNALRGSSKGVQFSSKYNRIQHHRHSNLKNPEFYKSIVNDFKQERRPRVYEEEQQRISHFSPDPHSQYSKYQNTKLKTTMTDMRKTKDEGDGYACYDQQNRNRYSVTAQRGFDLRKSLIAQPYQHDAAVTRLRTSQFQQHPSSLPFDNIQNRAMKQSPSNLNQQYKGEDIDKKIAQIRKKYQDFSTRPGTTTAYNNFDEKLSRNASTYQAAGRYTRHAHLGANSFGNGKTSLNGNQNINLHHMKDITLKKNISDPQRQMTGVHDLVENRFQRMHSYKM